MAQFTLDPNLKQFATERQWEYLVALAEHGSERKAAAALGVARMVFYQAKKSVERKAVERGYAPDFQFVKPLPEGQVLASTTVNYTPAGEIKGFWNKSKQAGMAPEDAIQMPDPKLLRRLSTMTDSNGDVRLQWSSYDPDKIALREVAKEMVAAFLEGAPPIEVGKGPSKYDTDVIPWFQIGDAHIGALAHEAETGANFDLKIAERELCEAFAILFDECPFRERCVINDLGDATHYENMAAVTEASGHPLDADGRFPKMIRVYSRITRFIVERALTRFKYVDLIFNQGNHSRTNDIWMAELIRQLYAGNDRVNVLDNSSVFIPYRMGNTFVMVHHSDKTKPEKLIDVMCNDFRQDWGETEFHYIDVGHLHHKMAVKEGSGCTIEMWNTLANKDKWAHDNGYRAHQSITRVDRSKTYGEIGRRVLPIREIRDIIAKAAGSHYLPPERRAVFTV